MGLALPHELTTPMSWLGLEWPQADEDRLAEAGHSWIEFSQQLSEAAEPANQAAQRVWTATEGDAAAAFQNWWTDDDGPQRRLSDDAKAALLIGGALLAFAAITLTVKLSIIAQLISLAALVAQAIATAFVTFGATTAEIPGFIAVFRVLIRQLIHRLVTYAQSEVRAVFDAAKRLLKRFDLRVFTTGATRVPAAGRHLDPRLQEYFDASRATRSGRVFLEAHDDDMFAASDLLPVEPGRFVVAMHGNEYTTIVGQNPVSPSDLASLIRHDDAWQGQPVRLFSCSTGTHPGGPAQKLADELRVPVHAPTKPAWSMSDGTTLVTSMDGYDAFGRPMPKIPPDGEWLTFLPTSPAAPPAP